MPHLHSAGGVRSKIPPSYVIVRNMPPAPTRLETDSNPKVSHPSWLCCEKKNIEFFFYPIVVVAIADASAAFSVEMCYHILLGPFPPSFLTLKGVFWAVVNKSLCCMMFFSSLSVVLAHFFCFTLCVVWNAVKKIHRREHTTLSFFIYFFGIR
jgi:hypothetical protein